PDHIYDLTISCPDSRPFSSRSEQSLEPVKLRFVTRSLTPADQQRTMNVAAFDEAKRVMEEYYVHYDRKGVDWNARFEEMRSRVVDAPGSALWTERMVELLSVADDPLIWLTYDGAYTRTCRRGIEPNFNYKTAEKTIGKLTRRSQYVYSARTDDGIGYVLIYSWEGATDETTSLFDQVLALMEDTRALIIDVRPNEGGIPETAISVAGWFVQDETVVLKTIFRDARRPSGMTPPFERKVSPRDATKRYENRVAILMGAKTMASSEWFVLAAKAGRRVRTFGAKTRGASGGGYCSQLPNAVQFCVARSRDVLPDGSSMDGITPDIPVEAKDEDFKTSDPVLEAALAALRKRIK
ncbi:MAG: hypothetical protein KDA33_10345, partial [Phycisphaerales bacterium]|nr:hypothetical protein [Phycisphaerales bacterium]